MKKSLLAVCVSVAVLVAQAIPVFAYEPEYSIPKAQKVVVDGKIDAGEWDGAEVISINAENKYISAKVKGLEKSTKADLSSDYQIKWDENNLYILEVRNDPKIAFSQDNLDTLYLSDATLFFIKHDKGGEMNGVTDTFHIFYSAGSPAGKAVLGLREPAVGNSVPALAEGKIASIINGSQAVIEVAVPWSKIRGEGKAGNKYAFTLVLTNCDDSTGANWGQFNWKTTGNIDTDAAGWAGFVLAEAPANADNSSETADTANENPTTGDISSVGFALSAVVSMASALVAKKRYITPLR